MSECYVNKVYVSGENLKDFEIFVSTENKKFSFDKVVPMPQTLNFNIGVMAGLAVSFCIWRRTGEGNLYIKETPDLTKSQKQLLIGNNNKPLSFSKTVKWEKTREEITSALNRPCIQTLQYSEEKSDTISYMFSGSVCDVAPKTTADFIAFGEKIAENIEKYGAADWHKWREENWGTPYECYDVEKVRKADNELVDSFVTNDSIARGIFFTLVKLFPNLNIEWFYADEEIGTNCGELYAQNGIVTEIDCDGDTDFAHTLWDIEAETIAS